MINVFLYFYRGIHGRPTKSGIVHEVIDEWNESADKTPEA
jgi:hypothetical protein